MEAKISRNEALALLRRYNSGAFHIRHALTVGAVMKWFAEEEGFGADGEFWEIAGLLHDIDFEQFPDMHCVKAAELLRAGGAGEELIHAVCSHGYGIALFDVKPEHMMEKILYAVDELTGLIWAAAVIRPSKSLAGMELKSIRKKYKTPSFAAGCSRNVIENGAALLGWELDALLEKTLAAMISCEASVNREAAAL